MLVSKLRSYPYKDSGVIARGVGQHLAQMVVIGRCQLALDDNWPVPVKVMSEDVQRISSDRRLGRLEFKFEPRASPSLAMFSASQGVNSLASSFQIPRMSTSLISPNSLAAILPTCLPQRNGHLRLFEDIPQRLWAILGEVCPAWSNSRLKSSNADLDLGHLPPSTLPRPAPTSVTLSHEAEISRR